MRAVLLSNIPHYHYLAQALHGAGMLQSYITSAALIDDDRPPAWLPQGLRRKLSSRGIHGVPRGAIRQVRSPEILQRLLPRLHVLSHERADWLNNELFDRLCLPFIEKSDAFHFVSSVGLRCARKAKSAGATIICDVRQEHPNFQRHILEEECARFGMKPRITGATYETRVLAEFALADYIVVPSRHARNTFLAEGFDSSRLLLLPYGVDLERFNTGAKSDTVFRVIYAGSLTVRKGPQYLLEAFSKMDRSNSELVLAGPIDPAFKKILARYEGQFRYAGVMSKPALQTLYRSGSVFVLPSLADSFSLATLEAMACGLPVIVSENTGASDALEQGSQGYVVPIRDSGAIQDRLMFLKSNESVRAGMGCRAAATAREWNWERYGRKSIEYYNKMQPKAGQFMTA